MTRVEIWSACNCSHSSYIRINICHIITCKFQSNDLQWLFVIEWWLPKWKKPITYFFTYFEQIPTNKYIFCISVTKLVGHAFYLHLSISNFDVFWRRKTAFLDVTESRSFTWPRSSPNDLKPKKMHTVRFLTTWQATCWFLPRCSMMLGLEVNRGSCQPPARTVKVGNGKARVNIEWSGPGARNYRQGEPLPYT